MPDNPPNDSEDRSQRFAATAGRYGWSLSVTPTENGGVEAKVVVKDLVTEDMTVDHKTDEESFSSGPVGTTKDVANWLENDVVAQVSMSKIFRDTVAGRVMELHNAVENLVHQLLGTRDRAADIHR